MSIDCMLHKYVRKQLIFVTAALTGAVVAAGVELLVRLSADIMVTKKTLVEKLNIKDT